MQKEIQNDLFEKSPAYDIETLIRQYGNDVLRTAYMYVKDIHTAEDIFQDVFIKVNQKLSTFEGNSSIKTWIIRITINTCKDFLKSAWNRRVVPMMEYQEDAIISDSDYEDVEKQDTNDLIKNAVLSLPAKYRDVVLCVYFQEMSVSEAAQALSIAEGTAKSRLSRARQKLKQLLEGRISDEF
ncbi:sigma-70 family RNA polymerase sigma factor [Mobilitalea sibirica]|uniref:Sigma-70 family RNA polymerase sigma factor n=1 Tax=Mobilitalea sibirica TaxID=1462919 RepID=A0A8J7H4A2_9FIRM|nr:sigma-70 family RNA polymerase sigma factor [Mobilitalea sibirica]MBH1939271.1 sigma-70 family RNA polymerase sigma factor [Mobilitalea sibirica]